MTNKEAIEFLKDLIDIQSIGANVPQAKWPYHTEALNMAIKALSQPTVFQWIPVKMRPMDSEERKYWEDGLGYKLEDEDAVMFDCPIPEDGQEILISFRKWINMDKCEIDGCCVGLEGNGDWEDVTAWMPLPEPWKGEEDGNVSL